MDDTISSSVMSFISTGSMSRGEDDGSVGISFDDYVSICMKLI